MVTLLPDGALKVLFFVPLPVLPRLAVGDLVSCFARIQKVGKTSITVRVEVFAQRARDGQLLADKVTEAVIVYVAIDEQGRPRPLPERGPDFGRYW